MTYLRLCNHHKLPSLITSRTASAWVIISIGSTTHTISPHVSGSRRELTLASVLVFKHYFVQSCSSWSSTSLCGAGFLADLSTLLLFGRTRRTTGVAPTQVDGGVDALVPDSLSCLWIQWTCREYISLNPWKYLADMSILFI